MARPAPAPEPRARPRSPRSRAPLPYVGRRIARAEAPQQVIPLVEAAAAASRSPRAGRSPGRARRARADPRARHLRSRPRSPRPMLVVEPSCAPRTPGGPAPYPDGPPAQAPLVAGLAILAVSAGGALQAMNPATAGAANPHRLVAANALSGSSGVASASLIGGRSTRREPQRRPHRRPTASRPRPTRRPSSATRRSRRSPPRPRSRPPRSSVHQWVLPVAAGVYHLTARFGDYSSPVVPLPHRPRLRVADRHPDPCRRRRHDLRDRLRRRLRQPHHRDRCADGTELWYCHQNAFGASVGATVDARSR